MEVIFKVSLTPEEGDFFSLWYQPLLNKIAGRIYPVLKPPYDNTLAEKRTSKNGVRSLSGNERKIMLYNKGENRIANQVIW
jgi:hypothetical protein